jgi:hypothetical protein
MALIRLFRLHQHKQFKYEPLFYDERKEQLQERIRNIEIEMGVKREGETGEIRRTLGRGSFSFHSTSRRRYQRQSSLRLIIIIIFLLAISYLLFFY